MDIGIPHGVFGWTGDAAGLDEGLSLVDASRVTMYGGSQKESARTVPLRSGDAAGGQDIAVHTGGAQVPHVLGSEGGTRPGAGRPESESG